MKPRPLKPPKPKEPFIPIERHETARKEISALLFGRTMSAKEISSEVRISEKEVYGHLEHIRKTLNKKETHLTVTPARCRKCGFEFTNRERLKKPGRCPICKGETIEEPLYSIKER